MMCMWETVHIIPASKVPVGQGSHRAVRKATLRGMAKENPPRVRHSGRAVQKEDEWLKSDERWWSLVQLVGHCPKVARHIIGVGIQPGRGAGGDVRYEKQRSYRSIAAPTPP